MNTEINVLLNGFEKKYSIANEVLDRWVLPTESMMYDDEKLIETVDWIQLPKKFKVDIFGQGISLQEIRKYLFFIKDLLYERLTWKHKDENRPLKAFKNAIHNISIQRISNGFELKYENFNIVADTLIFVFLAFYCALINTLHEHKISLMRLGESELKLYGSILGESWRIIHH